jgi:multidrug efflux pump subunit AcrA (membrane-fusion protein)
MKNCFIFFLLTLLIFSGCNRTRNNIVTYELKRSDYSEKIEAPGTIQAVNVMSLVAPRVPVSSMTVAYLADNGSIAKKGDTVCILSAPEIISRLETYKTSLETLMGDSKKLVADNALNLSMLEAQIDNNNARVKLNSLDSIQQRFAPPLNQKLFKLELEKATVEKSKLKKKYESLKRISQADQMRMKMRIAQSENLIKMTETQVSSLYLLSPSDGIVMHVVAPQMMFMSSSGMGTLGGKIEVNSSVWSNMAVLQVPDMSKMQVLVEVPEADYKRIEKGQKVKIFVEAAHNLNTTGSVIKKAPVGKKTQSESSIKTFEITVNVDSCHLLMTPGLSAKCSIVINEVKDTIVVPAIAIFKQDSLKVVYVAENEKFYPVIVETGLSNSTETIITTGLKGTETIALIEPPFNLRKREKIVISPEIVISDSIKKIDP